MEPDRGDELLTMRIEAENALLGCAMLSPQEVRALYGWVTPAMFHQEIHAKMWREIMAGGDPMAVALDNKMAWQLAGWMNDVVSFVHAEHYAKQVARGDYMARTRQVAIDYIAATLHADYEKTREVAQQFTQLQPVTKPRVQDMSDATVSLIEALQNGNVAIQTGIPKLDKAFGGLERRNEFVLAARPSMGKTALALQIARQVATAKHSVLYLSYEMPKEALLARMVCPLVGVTWRDVRAGEITPAKMEELINVASDIGMGLAEHFHIEDGKLSMSAVWEAAVAVNADLVIIDHLGLVPPMVRDNEVESLGLITKTAKDMAKQLNLAVLMLAQMNRGIEYRAVVDQVPRMSDLYGSGRIEQNADIIAFMHNRDTEAVNAGPPPNKRKVDLLIGKDRNGVQFGAILLDYYLKEQWFVGRNEPLFINERQTYYSEA